MINLDKTSSTKARVLSDRDLVQVVGGFSRHHSGGKHSGGKHSGGNQHKNGNPQKSRNQYGNGGGGGGGDTFITVTNNFFF